ncbi:MAG TPA: TMEM175 family protein [Ktedonobacteraceae bacterium]|nr:TMEM175 family protein [Ktedonobacteraceae bacterium]
MDEEKGTGRIEAFSDGVFAVAITLLVLSFQPPPNTESGDLLLWFRDQLPNFFAFVTSFATIGVMWINHHRLFTHIKKADTVLMALNLLLLLVIVFIPYPTDLVARYILLPNQHVAVLLYCGTSIVMAVAFSLLWRYAAKENRLLGENVNQREVQAITDQYRFGPLFYIVSFGLAFISAPASMVVNLLLAVFFALPGRKPRKPAVASASTDSSNEISSLQ